MEPAHAIILACIFGLIWAIYPKGRGRWMQQVVNARHGKWGGE